MSIEEKIIRFLYDRKYLNALAFSTLLQKPAFSSYKPQSLRNALTKLSKRELVRTGVDGIMLQAKGRVYVEQKMARLQHFDSPFAKSTPKNLLVLFDIPEDRKAERGWFRKQLREFDYDMVQKGVWLGPSPLPKEFVQYVKTIRLRDCIKTFRLARAQRKELKNRKVEE